MTAPKWKHRACPCGCGEMADECMKPGGGLNAFRFAAFGSADRCWRHAFEHREYVCTCNPPIKGDTGRDDDDAEVAR